MREERDRATSWIALGLAAASLIVVWPFLTWVLLATWTGVFARRVQQPLARRLGGRGRIAAVITLVALATLILPVFVLVGSLVGDAIDLVDRALASERAQDVLRQLVSGDGHQERSLSDLVDVLLSQGGRAWTLTQQLAGTVATIIIGLVIFVAGAYAIMTEGEGWYAWITRHAPVPASTMHRFAGAFVETGHGLFVGIAGAGLAQAVVATIAYVALGVPQAFALGLLTLGFSVLPAVGTAIVWVPIAAGLALSGRPVAAVVLAVVGVTVIGTVDNLVRPYLARRGQLQLPTYVVLVSMFGGIALLGARGLLLAPLIVRLAKEALEIRATPPT
jgi:predicted PurR-regulated permease PerM